MWRLGSWPAVDAIPTGTKRAEHTRYTCLTIYVLMYIRRLLAIPAIAGLALFAYQQFSGHEDSQARTTTRTKPKPPKKTNKTKPSLPWSLMHTHTHMYM